MAHSHGYWQKISVPGRLLAGSFSSLPYRSLHWAAWKSSWPSSWLPPTKWSKKKEQEKNHNVFYVLILDITHHQFGHILFLRSESLSIAHNQGKGNQALNHHSMIGIHWNTLSKSVQSLFYIFKELIWSLCGERITQGWEWKHRARVGGNY